MKQFKQTQHADVDALLRELPQQADAALGGLNATPFLKAKIDRAAEAKKHGGARFTLPRWVPAMACAALVLVLTLTFLPMESQPQPLIQTNALGSTEAPTGKLTSDLSKGSIFITKGTSAPGYRSIWSDVNDGAFPLIGLNGKYYRMLTSPNQVDARLLGAQVASIAEFTTEPSLSGTDVTLSNIAASSTPVYSISGISADTLVAAEVGGQMRLFQRVSFNGNALRGSETLADTLDIAGQVIAMELSSVGTVTDPDACAALFATLMGNASFESRGSISSRQALLIELDNGLVLQMAVKGDTLAACGVWSCPEFFEQFEGYCD